MNDISESVGLARSKEMSILIACVPILTSCNIYDPDSLLDLVCVIARDFVTQDFKCELYGGLGCEHRKDIPMKTWRMNGS